MSAARDDRPLTEVLDSGADDFLTKPPSPQVLYGRLRSAKRVLKLQQALIQQADIDHLTQLLNRGALMRRAEAALADAAAGRPLTLLQIDIDHFKSINDRFGHDVGDAVIRCVARILRETGAIAGRLGGEEFAVLMPGHGLAGAAVVAHRIRRQCAATAVPRHPDLRFTANLGVAERAPGAGRHRRHPAQAGRLGALRGQAGRSGPGGGDQPHLGNRDGHLIAAVREAHGPRTNYPPVAILEPYGARIRAVPWHLEPQVSSCGSGSGRHLDLPAPQVRG